MKIIISMVAILCLILCVWPINGEVEQPEVEQSVEKCYQCSSEYHANCSEGLDQNKFTEYLLQPCKHAQQRRLKATGCRKIVQRLPDAVTRYTRQCAFSGKSEDGRRDSGSMGIIRYIYQCDTDGCNGVINNTPTVINVIFTSVPLILAFVLTG